MGPIPPIHWHAILLRPHSWLPLFFVMKSPHCVSGQSSFTSSGTKFNQIKQIFIEHPPFLIRLSLKPCKSALFPPAPANFHLHSASCAFSYHPLQPQFLRRVMEQPGFPCGNNLNGELCFFFFFFLFPPRSPKIKGTSSPKTNLKGVPVECECGWVVPASVERQIKQSGRWRRAVFERGRPALPTRGIWLGGHVSGRKEQRPKPDLLPASHLEPK